MVDHFFLNPSIENRLDIHMYDRSIKRALNTDILKVFENFEFSFFKQEISKNSSIPLLKYFFDNLSCISDGF